MANDFLSQILKNRQQPTVDAEQQQAFIDQLLGSAAPLPPTSPAEEAQRKLRAQHLQYNSLGSMPSFPPELYEQNLAEAQGPEGVPPQGMAESLFARAGDASSPEMGMAESLASRSGGINNLLASQGQEGSPMPQAFRKEAALQASARPSEAAMPAPDDLKAAQERSNMLQAVLMMGKGAEKIGSSIAGTQSDANYLDSFKPFVHKPVEDVLTQRKAKREAIDTEAAAFSLANAKDADEPNSVASKFARDNLRALSHQANVPLQIPDNISAAELQKQFPTLMNVISAKMAQDARLEQAKISAEAKSEGRKEKTDEDKKKFTQTLRRELTQGKLGEMFANVNHAQRANGAIEAFMKDPTGYSDYGTLMTALKTLQGDQSVVREAEIRLGMQAGSFQDKILNQIESLRTGKSLRQGQRENILKSVKILGSIADKQYKEAIKPQLEQAKEEGIDSKFILPGNIRMDGQESAGDTVVVKRKTDGVMKRVSAEDAKKILKDPAYEKAQ